MDNLYRDFCIPLSELREEWKKETFAIKGNYSEFNTLRSAIRFYVELRKKKYLEEKIKKMRIRNE